MGGRVRHEELRRRRSYAAARRFLQANDVRDRLGKSVHIRSDGVVDRHKRAVNGTGWCHFEGLPHGIDSKRQERH